MIIAFILKIKIMKKLLFILFTILITFPLFGQRIDYRKTYNEEQLKKFFSVDTIKTDSVYTINYTLYIDKLISDYPYHNYWSYYNRYYYPYYSWSYYYNWYYDDWFYSNYEYYWFYKHNWYNNYHYNPIYKPKPIRQRTIATSTQITKPVVKPARTREYVRPVKTTTTNSRYSRPASTYNGTVNRVRQSNTYNRPTTTRKPTSTYNRPTRGYSAPIRSNNSSNNRSGSSTRSGSSNGTSSRGRR